MEKIVLLYTLNLISSILYDPYALFVAYFVCIFFLLFLAFQKIKTEPVKNIVITKPNEYTIYDAQLKELSYHYTADEILDSFIKLLFLSHVWNCFSLISIKSTTNFHTERLLLF